MKIYVFVNTDRKLYTHVHRNNHNRDKKRPKAFLYNLEVKTNSSGLLGENKLNLFKMASKTRKMQKKMGKLSFEWIK